MNKKLLIGLTSGKELLVDRVKLFPEGEIQQVLSMKAKAQEELGGFSTGLGFLGSPGWVIGGAVALGFVESLVSNSKMKNGFALLRQAAVRFEQLKGQGYFFDVIAIEGIVDARPNSWRAIGKGLVDLNPMGFFERGRFMQEHGISRQEIKDGKATAPTGFIYNGDEFIWFEAQGKPTAVRWEFVESYQLIEGS